MGSKRGSQAGSVLVGKRTFRTCAWCRTPTIASSSSTTGTGRCWPSTYSTTFSTRSVTLTAWSATVSSWLGGSMTEPTRSTFSRRHVAGEPGHVLGCGVQHDVLGCADLLDAAVEHDGHSVRELERLVEIVGDEDDGLPEQGLQAQELVLHLLADERVEGGERLVEKPDVGLHRERSRDPHPLLLAAGKLPREVVLAALQADESDHPAGPLHVVAALHAPHLEREGDVLERGAMGQEGEVLKHHAHLAAPQIDEFPVAHREQVRALDLHRAGRGLDEARETAHQGRFPRPRQAHHDQGLAGADIQSDMVDRGDHAVALEDGGLHHALAVGAQIRWVEAEDLVQRPTADDGLGHGTLPALMAGGRP